MKEKFIYFVNDHFKNSEQQIKRWAMILLILSICAGFIIVCIGLRMADNSYDSNEASIVMSSLGIAVGLYLVARINTLLLYGFAEIIAQSKKQTELLKLQMIEK